MNVDIGITKGSYWGGAQLPYWLLMTLSIFPLTGLLGLDHFMMRSPITGLLKILSIIPLLGFWYFYDIAQVIGEREFVEKHGMGLPFVGPQGIGAGMFFNGDKSNAADPKKPQPWKFALYSIFTLLAIGLPLNKIVIGDYWAALFQGIWLIAFPFTILALFWGVYDIYMLLGKPKELLEKGPVRITPASWVLDPNYDNTVLGTLPPPPGKEDLSMMRLIKKYFFTIREVFDAFLSTISAGAKTQAAAASFVPGVIGSATLATASIAPQVAQAGAKASLKLAQQVPEFTQKMSALGIEAGGALVKAAKDLPNTVKELAPVVAKEAPRVAASVVQAAEPAVRPVAQALAPAAQAVGGVVETAAGAAQQAVGSIGTAGNKVVGSIAKTGELVAKVPEIGEKISSRLSPDALIAKAQAAQSLPVQSGGSLMGFLDHLPDGVRQKAIRIRNTTDEFHDNVVNLSQQVPDAISTVIRDSGDTFVVGVESVTDGLERVLKVVEKPVQSGGALLANSEPSVSSSVLLFSAAALAAGGYAVFLLRKGLKAKKDIRLDDSPPDTRGIRVPAKA
jgi:hypothetical protein